MPEAGEVVHGDEPQSGLGPPFPDGCCCGGHFSDCEVSSSGEDRWLGLPDWFAPRISGIPWAVMVIFTGVISRFLIHGPTIFGLSRFQFGQVEELFIYILLLNYAFARRAALLESPSPYANPV